EEDEFDRYVKIVDTKHVDNRSTFDPSIESKSVKLHNDRKIISNIDEDLSYVVPNRSGYLNENKKSFNLLKIPIKNESKVEIVNYSSSVPIEQFSEKNKSSLIDYGPYNIPYVEVPDYSDEREESLDEEDRLRAKQRYVLNQSNSTNLSIDAIDEQINITSDHAPPVEKNNDVNEHQSPSSRLMATTNVVESSGISSERAKNDLINHQESKKNENNVNDTSEIKKKSNEEGPAMLDIDFDINEYRKPFDLDDFLKNEPFFQKLKNNNNNKRNSKEQLLEDNKNNYSFMSKNANNNNDNNSDDDNDEDPSKDTKNERINDDMISEEKDFLDRYFSKDVIDKLKTNSDEKIREENRRKNIEENKKRTLKTLSSILEKKDRISRFDEEANKDIEDGVKKAPSFYKNYWSLEYELPAMKDIKRNEENMN
ncbi:GATOR complex protein WDR24-like, partial [Vespula pensylvanica]